MSENRRSRPPSLRIVFGTFAALAAFVVGLRIATLFAGISFWYVASDVAYVFGAPVYVGLLSQVGLLLWAAAAAVALLAWRILRRRDDAHEHVPFFRDTGLLTLVLLADDAFMLHEIVVPQLFGLPEVVPLLGIAVLVALWAQRHADVLSASERAVLLATIGFGALSVGLDVVQHIRPVIDHDFFEDGAKFIATGGWLVLLAREAMTVLGRDARDPRTDATAS